MSTFLLDLCTVRNIVYVHNIFIGILKRRKKYAPNITDSPKEQSV